MNRKIRIIGNRQLRIKQQLCSKLLSELEEFERQMKNEDSFWDVESQ